MAKGCEIVIQENSYKQGFLPYALGAFLIGIVGGFSSVLGPAFTRDLGIAYNNTTWTALAQAMSTAAFSPILGKAADRFGMRNALLLGIGVFSLGNILSALANSLVFMMIARFIVGIGSAAIGPAILSYIATEFPRDRIAKGFSLYMLLSGASVIIGPGLGGMLVASHGWRYMLWVCVGICALVLLACLFTARKDAPVRRSTGTVDKYGSVGILLFFSLLLCIPSFGQNFGWSSVPFLSVLFASVGSLVFLLVAEKHAAQPILSGSFIKRRVFILSILALFLTQGLMQANMTNTVVFINYTMPENTAVSGYAISVMYIGMSLGAILLGPLADRFSPKKVLFGSFLITALGCCVLLFLSSSLSVVLLMASLGILGFGLGANGTVFMKVCLSGLPRSESGSGTGTYSLFRDLAAPFGVAVFVPLFTNQITDKITKGFSESVAALLSMEILAKTELLCVALGILALIFLPRQKMQPE
ncbi:MAG: MFS transporter [Oscillospiraceae bacterium]|nr:MFS transporter [Oscillospiraceae bacterium]